MFDFNQIGLSGRDKRIYEALLTLRHASVRSIAMQTNINRGSVYESLQALKRAGLVAYTTYGKRQKYTAQPPQLLHELVDEKRRELTSAHSAIDEYAHALRSTQQVSDQPFATSHEDDEGLASILRDVIAELKESHDKSYRVISSADLHDFLYHNFKNYTHERIKHGISVKVIAHEKDSTITKGNLAERRILPSSSIKVPRCYTIIYGTKTAFIALSDTNVPRGVVIDNPDVTNLQIALFDKLWRELG
jgi:HTH-type transcriptional regulator, sugar sensing transcriptional regulator